MSLCANWRRAKSFRSLPFGDLLGIEPQRVTGEYERAKATPSPAPAPAPKPDLSKMSTGDKIAYALANPKRG